MPNHVHLILCPRDGKGLARALGAAHKQWANFINGRGRWHGHLFDGRFGSVAMDEGHLVSAIRYVALMGLFDSVQGNLDSIAGKVGMTPEQVSNITATLETKLQQSGGDHLGAVQATAAEHGITSDQVQELLNHSGVADQVIGFAKRFLGLK